MPVEMSPKPKRIRTTILNGIIYEGGFEEAYAQQAANMGGARAANSLPGGAEEVTEEEAK